MCIKVRADSTFYLQTLFTPVKDDTLTYNVRSLCKMSDHLKIIIITPASVVHDIFLKIG